MAFFIALFDEDVKNSFPDPAQGAVRLEGVLTVQIGDEKRIRIGAAFAWVSRSGVFHRLARPSG